MRRAEIQDGEVYAVTETAGDWNSGSLVTVARVRHTTRRDRHLTGPPSGPWLVYLTPLVVTDRPPEEWVAMPARDVPRWLRVGNGDYQACATRHVRALWRDAAGQFVQLAKDRAERAARRERHRSALREAHAALEAHGIKRADIGRGVSVTISAPEALERLARILRHHPTPPVFPDVEEAPLRQTQTQTQLRDRIRDGGLS